MRLQNDRDSRLRHPHDGDRSDEEARRKVTQCQRLAAH
jgi:hypothetical protein